MTDKEKLHQILSSLWKNDDSVGKTYYNQALQDVQTAVDLQEEPLSEGLDAELDKYIKDNFTIDKEQLDRFDVEEKDYMYSMDKSDMLKMVRHFTNNYKVPASEDLEEAAKLYVSDWFNITNEDDWDDTAVDSLNIFKVGAEWQKENLWKPADGDDLPEYDREVIAILDYDFGHYKVVYAHRPNPNGWDGTNIDTGEKEHFEPEIYDKGCWNQPHVLYWLDTILPYEENKIIKEL